MEDKRRDVIVLSATQVGKSVADAIWLTREVWERPSPTMPYWWVAPKASQSVIGFRYMSRLAITAGILAADPTVSPYPMLRYINGGIVEFRTADEPQNLMGTPIRGAVFDEAGQMTSEAQGAVSSRRSSSMGPIRYSGNPGVFSGAFRRLCAMAEDPANVLDYGMYRWTWRDKFNWLATVNEAAAWEYCQFIERERQSIKPEAEFLRLYEAEWTPDEAQMFRGIGEPDGPPLLAPEPGHEYVIGVDVGQQVDYLVATVACRDCWALQHMDRWRGIPYPQSADRLAAMSRTWRAPLVIEINGPGLGVYQDLQQRGVSTIPFTTTGPSKQEIIVSLASELERTDKRLRIADMPPMHAELGAYRYLHMPAGNYRYGAPDGEHDDCVISAALACWGIAHQPHAGLLRFMKRAYEATLAEKANA